MIISASRRTDIPAYYSDWFFNRIKEGFVLVRNPMNFHKVGKVRLSPEVVDGIVFWTKNPVPMMDRLDEIGDYPYYFQFTLTSYGKDVEPNVPSKNEVIIPAFQKLSRKIGRDRVVWRYDPIFLSESYTIDYHCRYFGALAERLHEYTDRCTLSFIDHYRKTERNARPLGIIKATLEQKLELMGRFSAIAAKYDLKLDACAEEIELEQFGIARASCIDKARLERIGGYALNIGRDRNQRPECRCAESIDIGMYDTCKNGCLYCYANYSPKAARENFSKHDANSPLLCGELTEGDVVRERPAASCRSCQMNLFSDV